MKRHLLLLMILLGIVVVPTVPVAVAADPQVFMGVAGSNGYVTVSPSGVRYNLSNDGSPWHYGYCRHHHKHHRCRHVAPPRYVKHHKHHDKHYKKHHDNGRRGNGKHHGKRH